MKLKKILAAVAAAAVAVSTMAFSAFAVNIADGDLVVGTDWQGVEISADKLADVAEGTKITLTYTITPADYNLVRLSSNTEGWVDLECHAGAVCNVDDPNFKHQDGNDFMVVSIDGSVTYTLTAKDAENVKANGARVNGYCVVVKSVDVENPAAPAADAKSNVAELNKDAGFIDGQTPSVTITNADFGVTDIKSVSIDIAIAPKAGSFEWNDWCGNAVKVTDADGVRYYAWGGAQVTWNNDVDKDKVDDIIGGVNGDQWLGTVKNGAITLNVAVNGDFTIDIITMCYDAYDGTIYTVKTATADGVAVAAAPAETTETAAAPAEEETAAPEEDEAEAEDVDEDVDYDEDEEEDAPAETEAAAPAETEAAPAVANATAAPATGNTAVASIVAVMAVAGAAAIVAKKRK